MKGVFKSELQSRQKNWETSKCCLLSQELIYLHTTCLLCHRMVQCNTVRIQFEIVSYKRSDEIL